MSEYCPSEDQQDQESSSVDECAKKHLVIIGGGSAAFSAAIKASELGADVTIINEGLPIGGTCVNVGCVPSKALIRASQAHNLAKANPFKGIKLTARLESFKDVVDEKNRLVSELRQAKYVDIVKGLENVTIIEGHADLVGPKEVRVKGKTVRGDKILIATGSSPYIVDVPGLQESKYLTSKSALSLKSLPKSMIVLGGRYIALELGQMFSRFGCKVTILQRSSRILPNEERELTDALAGYLREEGLEIVTGVSLREIRREGGKVKVRAQVEGEPSEFSAEELLVATGRRANTEDLNLDEVGVARSDNGAIIVNDHLETSVDGIYAAGDVIGNYLYVYAAAYEGALAAENSITGNAKKRDYTAIPWVIFTDPQVSGVGLDLKEAKESGFDVEEATLPLKHVPKALVARDTRGLLKLVRNSKTDRLLGARILAPEGGELIMEASLAIKYGIRVSELAKAFHPYLTLSEAIKLAAISFGKDVSKLSCCAS